MNPMHPLWPDDTGSPLGEKIVPARPAQDEKPEQWLPTGTPGYVRSNTTGAVKTEKEMSMSLADQVAAFIANDVPRILANWRRA